MIDKNNEELLPLREAAKLLPRRRAGKPTHAATLLRWAQKGLRGVRLEVVQVGATKCTTEKALRRFFDELGSASNSNREG